MAMIPTNTGTLWQLLSRDRYEIFFSFLSLDLSLYTFNGSEGWLPFHVELLFNVESMFLCAYNSNNILPAYMSNNSLCFLCSTCPVKLLCHSWLWWKRLLIWSSAWNVIARDSRHPRVEIVMSVWNLELLYGVIITLLNKCKNFVLCNFY